MNDHKKEPPKNASIENLADFSHLFSQTTEKMLPVLIAFTETGTITKKGMPKNASIENLQYFSRLFSQRAEKVLLVLNEFTKTRNNH